MTPEERAHIEALLADDGRSFRAISRETGFSDWTIRRVARELAGDERPMKTTPVNTEESTPAAAWTAFAILCAIVIGLAVLVVRSTRPPDFPSNITS